MLSALLQKRSLFCLYRLVKPNISEFKSIEDLEYDQKQRQLALIQQINIESLTENKSLTKQRQISSILNVSEQTGNSITKKHLNFSAISPKSLKHFTLQQNLQDGKIDYPFLLEQVEQNLPDLNQIPMHYSYKRGIPIISEYEMDKKIAYVFNLPQDLNTRQISQKLGLETIKQIKVEYCRLGLPAYAKIYFNSDEAVTNLVLNNKTYIEVGNRICFIKTHFDKEKLDLKNRRLVVQNIQEDQEDLILHLSQYGRIVHFDYPTFITRNSSLEQVRQKYKNGDGLIKINHHRKDGSVQSEYYPSVQETFKMNTTPSEFQANLVQKKERQNAIYQNRMRYAQQIDVFEGKENQISIKNMGYCIVSFSCTQEAQNCYFNMRMDHKMALFDNKTSEEFEIDQNYRKRMLRFIDSEYRKTKDIMQGSKTLYGKQMDEYFDELSLFDKLIDLQTQKKALEQKIDDFNEQEPQVLLSYFTTRAHEIKRDLSKKLGSKSFDELAQKELFGRVLPKHDPKRPKLAVAVMPELSQDLKQIIQGERLEGISTTDIKNRDKYYKRLKSRESKRKGLNQQILQVGEQVAQGQQAEVVPEADDEFTGTRGFSTIKKRYVAFRTRNPLEQANYILRYCQYVRGIINEYQGIFPQNRLKSKAYAPSTFLNPEALTMSDGSEFVTQEDLPKFLECLRNPSEAQNVYSDFWKDSEYFKSRNININEYRHRIQNNFYQAIQKYADSGVVKEVYQVDQGEDIEAKVNYLNATVAAFGQQFRVHQDGEEKVIIKVAKVQNICPLDKITRFTNTKAKLDRQYTYTQSQQQTFAKFKHQMIQSGQIPQQIRKQFDIPADKTLDDLFEELASQAGIYKKDIQTLLNLQNFTGEQIGGDVSLQIEMQKARIAEKQSRASDFAKDPSNIEVRDKEGYFKVSKFRQI